MDRVDEKFTVSPTVQQRLENKVQESSAFLSKINVYPVTEQEGEKLGLGVSGPIASTTDTSQQDRQTADISTLDGRRYRCEQTNSDTHITYQKLDAWAKFPDFQTRIRDAILKRQALDRMTIGFNGVKRTPTSNRVANPLLQDVNTGWLQHVRDGAARVMRDGKAREKSVGKLLKDGKRTRADYATLDAVVFNWSTNWSPRGTRRIPSWSCCAVATACRQVLPAHQQRPRPSSDRGRCHRQPTAYRQPAAVRVPFFPALA